MLLPHSDLFPTRELHTCLEVLLLMQPCSVHIRSFDRKWLGTPKQVELKSLDPELLAAMQEPLSQPGH
jgi:hypothetical protein